MSVPSAKMSVPKNLCSLLSRLCPGTCPGYDLTKRPSLLVCPTVPGPAGGTPLSSHSPLSQIPSQPVFGAHCARGPCGRPRAHPAGGVRPSSGAAGNDWRLIRDIRMAHPNQNLLSALSGAATIANERWPGTSLESAGVRCPLRPPERTQIRTSGTESEGACGSGDVYNPEIL